MAITCWIPRRKSDDAVHLPFYEQRVASLPDRCLRLVEIEKDLALGVERRLGRVDVFGSGFVSRVEGASGERDDAAAFIGNGKHDPLAESVVDRTLASIALFLGAEQSACPQCFLICHAAQPIAKRVEAVGCKADAKDLDSFGCQPTPGQVFARDRSFGAAQLLFKPCRGSLMQIEELSTHACFGGLFGRGKLSLGQRDSALLRDNPHCFGETDVFDFADKAEHVPGNAAAKAVIELADSVDGEGWRLLFVKGAKAGVVLCAGLAQTDVCSRSP